MSSEQYLIGRLEEAEKEINNLRSVIENYLKDTKASHDMEDFFIKALWYIVVSRSPISPICNMDFDGYAKNVKRILGRDLVFEDDDKRRAELYKEYLLEIKERV